MSKGRHGCYLEWNAFCRLWRKVAAAYVDPFRYKMCVESREKHLAKETIGAAMAGWEAGTHEGLLAYAEWELEECMQSLDPETTLRGEAESGFHAGCCALRATAALHRLRKLG